MINHQDQITILTPTMNRSEFVLRSLQYYAKVGFTGTFMIGDSSNKLERTKIESYIAEYKSKLRIIYLYFPTDRYKNDAICMREMIEKADTPYLVYAGDDDILIPNTLAKCAKFLEENANYSAAHGVFVAFSLIQEGAFGDFNETYYVPNHVITSDSARVRWQGYIRHALSTQYYVHRKETWQLMYRDLPNVPLRYLGPEVLPCSMSVIAGKIAEINELSVLFQINRNRPFGWTTHSIYSLWLEDGWTPALRGLRNAICKEFVERDQISIDKARTFFDREMWRHLIIMLQAHYDIREYEPINIFNKLKRQFKGVVRLWNVGRQLRSKQYRNCAINHLKNGQHPFNKDFMPVYSIVAKASFNQ